MANITAAGSGSGIDVEGILTSLLNAERVPVTARLDRREIEIQAEISAYGSLQGALSAFKTALSPLSSVDTFAAKSVNSSDSSLFSVSATNDSPNGTFSVEVLKLAVSEKLTSADFASADAEVGSGVLTVGVGGESFDITVANSTNGKKLSSIRDSINDASDNVGVTASILTVDDGMGGTVAKLILTSDKTGAANTITVTAVDDDLNNTDNLGLSRLVYDPGTATNLSQTTPAADAEINVDGYLVKSATNVFSEVLDGVSITAIKTDLGNVQSLTIGDSTTKTKSNIEKVVLEFNALATTLDYLTDYDREKNEAGLLTGDATVRTLESQLRRTLTGQIAGGASVYDSLASLGITTNKEGLLEIDSARLDAALSADPAGIAEVFADSGGVVTKLNDLLDGFLDSEGVINTRTESFDSAIDDINDQRDRLVLRLESLDSRYRAQFTRMDILVAQFQQTGNFLTQQLSAISGIISRDKK